MWDKNKILNNKKLIFDTLKEYGKDWMLNLICLEEGKSYILASDKFILKDIQKLLKGKMEEEYLKCKDIWLRKEIIKQADI